MFAPLFLFPVLIPVRSDRLYPLSYTEIPRVIAAQQQNTAPEVQQYDADPYQTDSDSAPNNGGKIRHLIIIDFKINDGHNNSQHKNW